MKTKLLILMALIIGLMTGCKSTGTGTGTGTDTNTELKPNYSTPSFIIDSHMHYRATDEWEKSFVEIYTAHNAMACLFMSMKDLERGIAFANAHPDRVIPYAAVDIESPTVIADIQKAYDMGYKGLGELFASGDCDYNDAKYEPIWTMAEKLGLPIAPHTGNLSNGLMDHLRPAPLADICSRHPKLMIHAAHFGNPWYE